MQLEAILNIDELTAAEVAQFELKCREMNLTPEKKAAELIRQFSRDGMQEEAAA